MKQAILLELIQVPCADSPWIALSKGWELKGLLALCSCHLLPPCPAKVWQDNSEIAVFSETTTSGLLGTARL